MNLTENYSEWSKADLIKHIFSLQQENKRLEDELQQTKAQLEKIKQVALDKNISDQDALNRIIRLTNIK